VFQLCFNLDRILDSVGKALTANKGWPRSRNYQLFSFDPDTSEISHEQEYKRKFYLRGLQRQTGKNSEIHTMKFTIASLGIVYPYAVSIINHSMEIAI
jgi:hypothetical protein